MREARLHESVGAAATAREATGSRTDLLRWAWLRAFLTSRYYPWAFQAVSWLVFGLILYFAFFGTIRPGRNFATVVTWTLWWPLLPLSILLLGRAWCAVCPVAAAIGGVHRLAGAQWAPPRWLVRNSVWIMGASFVLLTWADRTWSITGSPRATGLLLASIFAAAVLVALLYRRKAFCRYLCPIGAFTGLYAMNAAVELRARPSACQGCTSKACYKGSGQVDGCPLYQFPRSMDSNRNCNLCAQCLKGCPRQALELRARLPGRELWNLRTPLAAEAVLAVVLIAVVFTQTLDMTKGWGTFMKWVVEHTFIQSYGLAFTITFGLTIMAVLATYLVIVSLARPGHGQARLRHFSSYGYVYLPLALAAHLGHNVAHLAGEGPRAVQTAVAAVIKPFGLGFFIDYNTIPSLGWTTGLTVAVLVLGGAGSGLAVWKLSQREGDGQRGRVALPHLALAAALFLAFLGLFLLPMNPRHAH